MMLLELIVTEKQAEVIKDALDFYSRIGAWQLSELIGMIRQHYLHHDGKALLEELYDDLKSIERQYQVGISSNRLPDRFKVAYDIQQVLRHFMAWQRNPKGGYLVDFNPPMQFGSEPLPQVS